jgi:DNA-binding PadR family transcriptional regulator
MDDMLERAGRVVPSGWGHSQAPRIARTPRALVVLALLCEREMHPYEMQQVIRERALSRVVRFTQGSLYHAVEKLAEAELITAVGTRREGRRPERTVYAITDAGRDAVHLHLREMLSSPSGDMAQFVTAISMAPLLSPDELAEDLARRVVALEALAAAEQAIIDQLDEVGLERVSLIEVEYMIAMVRAEVGWLRAIQRDLRAGKLTWRPRDRDTVASRAGVLASAGTGRTKRTAVATRATALPGMRPTNGVARDSDTDQHTDHDTDHDIVGSA